MLEFDSKKSMVLVTCKLTDNIVNYVEIEKSSV